MVKLNNFSKEQIVLEIHEGARLSYYVHKENETK